MEGRTRKGKRKEGKIKGWMESKDKKVQGRKEKEKLREGRKRKSERKEGKEKRMKDKYKKGRISIGKEG